MANVTKYSSLATNSAVDSSEWLERYDIIKKQILSRKASGIIFSSNELKGILMSIQLLEVQLQRMLRAPTEYDIFPSEIARRKFIIDNLRKLAETSSISVIEGNIQHISTATTSTPAVNNLSMQSSSGLLQRQDLMVKLQNVMMEDIEQGVDRLIEQASLIKEETGLQTRLLDDLEETIDFTSDALMAEAKQTEKLKEQTDMWRLYICLILEVIIIILLLIIWVS